MHVEIGRNTLDPQNLPGPEVIQQLQALLAQQPGYRGYLAVEIGDGQRVFVRLWDSAADAKGATENPALREFTAKYISPAVTHREVVGHGPAIIFDFSELAKD